MVGVEYDIPEWSFCYLVNGDEEGLTEEEKSVCDKFISDNFPKGFLIDVDFDDYNEFNRYPDFGTRNENALTIHGESPFLACKTYKCNIVAL